MQVVLTVVEGPHLGQTFAFDQHDHFFVGRAKFAHFRLPEKDPYFSRMHFMIEVNPPACRLLDLGSRNGTRVNGQPVQSVDLHHGDLIAGGNTVLRVNIRDEHGGEIVETMAKPAPVADKTPAPTRPIVGAAKMPAPPNAEPADPVQTGWQLPGYELREVIGRGNMGIVYRGVRLADNLELAVKVIQPKVVGSEADFQRFLREIDILRQLDHPAIVHLIEAGEADGLLYFSMELIDGMDAGKHVKQQKKPMSVRIAVGIICQVLDALEHAHGLGFVHRDVKPSNILLARNGNRLHVKLSDFGLARAYEESKLSGLTLTGDICGTPSFMAPEQITDCRRVKPASDQYSAAATLYWLLTKHTTHDFTVGMHQVIHRILLEDPVPIADRRSDLPPALVVAIHRALQKDPADRYPSAAEFRQTLKAAIAG